MYVFYFLLLFTVIRHGYLAGSVPPASNRPTLEESKKLVTEISNDNTEVKAANVLNDAGVIVVKQEDVDLLKTKKTDLTTIVNKAGFDPRDASNIASAVATGLKDGLPDLVRGFKTKSPYYGTVGKKPL